MKPITIIVIILSLVCITGITTAQEREQCSNPVVGFMSVKWGSNNLKEHSAYFDAGIWSTNIPLFASISIGGTVRNDSIEYKGNNKASMGVFQLGLKTGIILKRHNPEYSIRDNITMYIHTKLSSQTEGDVGIEYMLWIGENKRKDNSYVLIDVFKTLGSNRIGANLGIRFGL